jgi:hypothetical protein
MSALSAKRDTGRWARTGTLSSPRVRTFAATLAFLVLLGACTPGAATPTGIVAVAYRLDAPALSAYVGPPGAGVFRLDPGTYLVEVADPAGRVRSLGRVTIGGARLDLSAPDGDPDPERSGDLRTLARFLTGADAVRLQTLRLLSGSYRAPLFDRSVADDAAGEIELAVVSRTVSDLRQTALAALGRVELRAQAYQVLAAAPGSPVGGLLDGVKEKLTGFVSALTRPGDRARQRIRDLGAKVRLPDQRDLFDAVPARLRGDAQDWPTFLARLDQISWFEMAQLESSLRNAAAYGGLAQEAGATTGQIMREEGANLVTKGAELNIAAVKATLIGAFPDIDLGFNYAKKADEYADYVQKLYRDPLGTLEGQARDTLTDKLKERIKKDIQACCPNVSPDGIAAAVAERAVDALPRLVATPGPSALLTATAAPSAAASARPTPTATPTSKPTPNASELQCAATVALAGQTATLTQRRGTNAGQLGGVFCTYTRPGGGLSLEASWIERGGDPRGYSLGYCGVNPSSQYVYSKDRTARVTGSPSGQVTDAITAAIRAYIAGAWLQAAEANAEPCPR